MIVSKTWCHPVFVCISSWRRLYSEFRVRGRGCNASAHSSNSSLDAQKQELARELVLFNSVFCPGFQKGRVPSEKGTRVVNGRSKGHFSAVNGPSKGHFSMVNGRKRALLTSALEWHNKRCTAQSTLCVGNKKGKTELKAMCD